MEKASGSILDCIPIRRLTELTIETDMDMKKIIALPQIAINKLIERRRRLTKLYLTTYRIKVTDVIYLLNHSNLRELKCNPFRNTERAELREMLQLDHNVGGTWTISHTYTNRDRNTTDVIHLRS